MIDPTPNEQEAILQAGQMGGEVLDEIGETDLARLTLEQWETFLAAIVGGYLTHLSELAARDQRRLDQSREAPF